MNNRDFIANYIKEPCNACYCHLMQIQDELINYSTTICMLDRENKTALFNERKYSKTTSKIQSTLYSMLESQGYTIETYVGDYAYYWNYGYQGADKWKRKDMIQRGYK